MPVKNRVKQKKKVNLSGRIGYWSGRGDPRNRASETNVRQYLRGGVNGDPSRRCTKDITKAIRLGMVV